MSYTVQEFQDAALVYEELARKNGLTFPDIRYEIMPADSLYTLAGFGLPVRFSHWSFGKHYHQMKSQYERGQSKIYELVINTDPCYAFFMDNNTLVQNKLIMAHILGHADFFHNNQCYRNTDRNMLLHAAAAAERFRDYEQEFGVETVESFIDSVMTFEHHIDPYYRPKPENPPEKKRSAGRYDDLWGVRQEDPEPEIDDAPQRDILLYILENNSQLKPWQQDVLSTLRNEMLYFWPQMQTKIMNEGWASYWHTELIRQSDMTPSETVDFATLSSGVMQKNIHDLNPYNVGYAMWKNIEKEYGREAMFEIRESGSDYTFIQSFLNQEVADECELYLHEFGPEGGPVAVEKDYRKVRDFLVSTLTNAGIPLLTVQPTNHRTDATLHLAHEYDGVEINISRTQKVLPHIVNVWGAPVSLTTVVEGRKIKLTCATNKKIYSEFL